MICVIVSSLLDLYPFNVFARSAHDQTLIFNGTVLEDDRDVEACEILHNSRIQLVVSDCYANKIDDDEFSSSEKVKLKIVSPSANRHKFVEMYLHDTVFRLKEKIRGLDPVPISRLQVKSRGVELKDDLTLCQCDLVNGDEICVSLHGRASKMKVKVLSMCETKRACLEVNPNDRVSILRGELCRLQETKEFPLPEEGYFFIHKQNVMEDDKSFLWHGVRPGDFIEIFAGYVTSAS